MSRWLRGLLGSEPKSPDASGTGATGDGPEVAGLRLELRERERDVAALKAELERRRAGEESRLSEAAALQWERLVTDAAGPVAQLLTQAHLLEAEEKPVQARDVLAVARRLVRVLQEAGLGVEEEVGRRVSFDPNRHEALSSEARLAPGEEVEVRVVGISYRGRVLRRAGVRKG